MGASASDLATIEVRQGQLRGRRSGNGAVFLGVPFAAPPIGPLRWRPPQAHGGWRGVRDALAFAPDFPQPPGYALRGPRQDEDALYLNVWTPTLDRGARLPVMAWVFGGGFAAGSASEAHSDGMRLAQEGAVVVAVSYRIGLFGFLAHPALSRESPEGVSGNYGLHDQMAAFAWLRENIESFGGDPRRVTAFGYSAGAASIALLLTAPPAGGLFDQAILQSPGAGRPLATLPQAERAGQVLGGDLGALRSLSARELLARTSLLVPKVRGLTTPRVLRPIRDGWLVTEEERTALAAGRFRSMPLIVGSNEDEGSLLTRNWPVDTVQDWREQVRLNFGAMAQEAEALYPVQGDGDARPRVAQMFADTQFNYGTRLVAQAMARREPRTWRYLFGHRSAGKAEPPQHGDEVPYVFGTLAQGANDADRAVSERMRKEWVAFAGSGDPNAAGSAPWPRYRPEEDRSRRIGNHTDPEVHWRQAQLDFLDRFYRESASA